jgi:hypothetical protein
MHQDLQRLNAVLRAAKALLEAREDQMVTSEEWDALREAVDAARQTTQPDAPQRPTRNVGDAHRSGLN